MRCRIVLALVTGTALMASCKKEQTSFPVQTPPPLPTRKVLLKDITIPNLPSPYYHFEYAADSTVTSVSFDSGLTNYDVIYNGNKISEMRNNIIVNHDTLRYVYDNMNKVTSIQFINSANILYRRVLFTYEGQQLKEVDWDQRDNTGNFFLDRVLTFTYFPDGNARQMMERRLSTIIGVPEYDYLTQWDQYDDKVNVDDFMLLHDGIHDHLFLPSGFRIQRNNPRKETFSGSDGFGYVVNYTYTYNGDGTPVVKSGNLLFTGGQQAGQTFHTTTNYSYY